MWATTEIPAFDREGVRGSKAAYFQQVQAVTRSFDAIYARRCHPVERSITSSAVLGSTPTS